LRAYAKNERLELVSGEAEARARVVQVWNDYRHMHGDDVLIIIRRNADAAALNQAARVVLRAEGRLRGPYLSLGRDKKIGPIEFAQGDRIRFGENLPQFPIRNGTRGTIERIGLDRDVPKVAVRLDDGRLIEEQWASLIREQPGRVPSPPRISPALRGPLIRFSRHVSRGCKIGVSEIIHHAQRRTP
jgi:ATP-dependent exoDNAse (exonuclease V) alpha subunit